MKIRTKAILIIVLTNLLIILFSVSSGILFVTKNNNEALIEYLSLTADLADFYLSNEIESLKKDIVIAAIDIASTDEQEWHDKLKGILSRHEMISIGEDNAGQAFEYNAGWVGIAVFEANTELIAIGAMPSRHASNNDDYIRRAIGGETALSSTYQERYQDIDGRDETFFYIAGMLPGDGNRILVVTLSGQYFSELLAGFRIWKTGHIFLSDAEGYAIGNPRANWVNTRYNYITAADTDDRYDELAETVTLMTKGETGIGYYTIHDTGFSDYARACAYRPISSSQEGWSLGVVAPLPENPFNNARTALLIVALFSVILNAVFAIFASKFIKKPFEEIVALKKVAETANTTKSAFLASMSHEIRTPMNAIIGMLELLTHEPLDDRQMNYVKDINHSATSLLSIINDILDMSKIESGKMELIPIDYDFLAFLDNMHSMFTYVAEEKGLEFRFDVDDDAPHYLYGDDIRLRQVIVNICGNAVKFTETGYVGLSVKNAGDTLIFEISDTGRGIKKEDIDNLFSAFQQTDSVKNRGITGTGLGLTICKSFIDLMGGSIEIESEYGIGSAFIVAIPLIQGDAEKAAAASVPKGRNLYAPNAKVLIVDDNAFNLKVAVGLLNLVHIDAETASSGQQAIEMVQNKDYHIVFMDHMMPDMDGVEAAASMRALGEKYDKLPIVALTANAVSGAKEFFLDNGFNDFVSKPIDIREIITVLEKWLPKELLEKAPRDIAVSVEAESGVSDEPKKITEPSLHDTPKQIAVPGIAGTPKQIEKSDFMNALEQIEYINTKIGLSGTSGVESLYYDAVEMCFNMLPMECEKMSLYIKDGDISSFAIAVHAMKSVLATIGAVTLSETALALETAAKNSDNETCEKLFPDFKDKLFNIHDQLSSVFLAQPGTETKASGDIADLKEGINKALAAVQDYDNDAGIAAIEPLLSFDFGDATNSLLEAAIKEFKEFDCDKAGEALSKVMTDK